MPLDYSRRQEQVRVALSHEGVHALLVTNPVNVTYLTGFSGDSSYLVLTANRAILLSDGRFTVQIAEECPGLEAQIRPPTQIMPELAGAVLQSLGVHTVGYESADLTVAEFQ